MGAWRPKHVEWLCRNKTCTVLHQVGVSFDSYCDARKHKIKIHWSLFGLRIWNYHSTFLYTWWRAILKGKVQIFSSTLVYYCDRTSQFISTIRFQYECTKSVFFHFRFCLPLLSTRAIITFYGTPTQNSKASFSTNCHLTLPLSGDGFMSFRQVHLVASYVFSLLFP